MIILLEGLDATGKTTISDKLQDKGFYKFRRCKPSETSLTDTVKQTQENISLLQELKELKKLHPNIVIDRFYISNFVYQFIFEHNFGIDASVRDEIRKVIDLIIYCKIQDNNVYKKLFEESCKQRHEDYTNIDLMLQAGALFDKVIQWESINKIVLNYDRTQNSIEDIMSQIQLAKMYLNIL